MEEDIKKAIKRMEEVRDKNVHTFVDELTIVLNELDRLQKENEKLKDKFILEKVAKEEIEELLANSIPKSVIQDNIYELGNMTLITVRQREEVSYAMGVLKELLNKGE